MSESVARVLAILREHDLSMDAAQLEAVLVRYHARLRRSTRLSCPPSMRRP